MNKLVRLISIIGLAAVIIPPVLYLAGSIEKGPMQGWMLAGTVTWFATAFVFHRMATRAS